MLLALGTLTIATLLALVPPVATKVIVDTVLGTEPLPASVPAWVPRAPWPLLVTIVGGVLIISFVKLAIHVWGRWHATRITKLLQVSVRRKVLDHAVRLPLHRVQELKAGGAASILRRGCPGRRRSGLRHAVQPVAGRHSTGRQSVRFWPGSTGDCCWGRLVLIPLVYLTHRTWIDRIRPQHRRIRAQREEVDA